MKNLVKMLMLLSCSSFATAVHSQQINIGDQCPDVTLSMLNYKTPTVKISDFRGQLLIIDFWATWCGPCVGMIPRTDSLQKQFEGRATILPVTYEDEKTVHAFYSGYSRVHHFLPYSATGDAALKQLFKPNQFPHYIWINPTGRVIAITELDEVNSQNIQKVLDGIRVKLAQKKLKYIIPEESPLFNVSTPIVDSAGVNRMDFLPQDSMLYHSVLTKYRPGYSSTMRHGDSTRESAINVSIKELFKSSLGRFQFPYLFDNLVKIETKDSLFVRTKLSGDAGRQWMRSHTYCYELVVPPSLASRIPDLMAEDLNRYFRATMGIEGVLEQRMTKCMVLTRTTKDDRMAATDTGSYSSESTRFHYKIHHAHMYTFINNIRFGLQTITTPIIDGTGYMGDINLELNCDMHNISEINNELAKYGLKFVEKNHLMGFVVIRDIKK